MALLKFGLAFVEFVRSRVSVIRANKYVVRTALPSSIEVKTIQELDCIRYGRQT